MQIITLLITGAYFCEADNSLGQTGKAELQVSVLYGPRVSVEKFKEVEEGGDVTVECRAKSNPEPISVYWTRVDQPRFRQTGRFLHLRNVTHVSGGQYTCVVTNRINPSGEAARERRGNASLSLAVRHQPGPGAISPPLASPPNPDTPPPHIAWPPVLTYPIQPSIINPTTSNPLLSQYVWT